MNLLRFAGLLLVFFGVLASCALTVVLLVLLLRVWPLLLIVALAIAVFGGLLKRSGIRITPGD